MTDETASPGGTPFSSLRALPELRALEEQRHLLRLPPEIDVPVTSRIMRLVDTRPFQRLARISQLGLVRLVYPGATHTRFEHSLGVYRLALLFLNRIITDPRTPTEMDQTSAETFLLAALLHDIGHWPFCHPLEDMRLPEIARHEALARQLICEGEIAKCIREDWHIQPEQVADLLAPSKAESGDQAERSQVTKLLGSMLSGPIDIDKMDYLMRDSLHAGVPYGRNFDQQRLISSLCLGPTGSELAIADKGRTAAEMMVFARYVMFSEVYWHHTVRSATAMLQRAVYMLRSSDRLQQWQQWTEEQMTESLLELSTGTAAAPLLQGLFGSTRRLYKRLAQFNYVEQPEMHRRLSRKPYPVLVQCAEAFAQLASERWKIPISPEHVLIDAPPVKLEVQFNVMVRSKQNTFRPLGELSPVVQTLATKQFDDFVKKVRLFIDPRWVDTLHDSAAVLEVLNAAVDRIS